MYFRNFLLSWWEAWFACIATAASILLSVYFLNGFFERGSVPSVRQDDDLAATQEDKRDPSVSAPPGFDYDVFLSFRGSDTRKSFTDFLYHSLIDKRVRVFRDHEELRVGEEIAPDLLQAINSSKISIPIFSRDYASSKWCLKEVAQMVKCRDRGKQIIFPIFYDVTPHDVRHQTGPFAEAFSQHMKSYRADTIQEWRDALNEIGALKGWEPKNVADGHEGQLVKIVVSKVLAELKNAYLVVTDHLVGVDDHVEGVMKLLEDGVSDVSIVGICGIGGMGKTTIAKLVYNQLLERFDHHCFLNDIRETCLQHKGLEYLQSVLISKILNCDRPDFISSDEGIREMQQRLCDKRVLILLDDVNQKSQLNALAGNCGWFAPGSRIIVTTRNKEILNLPQVGSRSRSSTYEVNAMLQDQALLLFCKHAFRKDVPTADLSSLSNDIVKTTGGLPLAVEVIGSFLHDKHKEVWKSTSEKLKQMPDDDVQKKLKISYDALDRVQKQIFLDIACYFIGMDRRIVVHMWEDCNFYPEVGIEVLSLMSLVKVADNELWMHDQLRDLGREIVRGENDNEPEKRSRLWHTEEATDVLQRLKEQGQGRGGTLPIEALCLDPGIGLENYCFTNEQFASLSNLRFLCLNNANLAGSFRQLLSTLRWLCWHRCPPDFLLTDLDLKNMVILDLTSSMITDNWDGWSVMQMAVKLKVLNLSECLSLIRTPVFSTFPTLERLILEGCRSLVVIDPSIGQLKSLVYLNVKNCWSLEKLPQELGSMGALSELLVDGTRIKEIPISKGMKKLEILSAEGCGAMNRIHLSLGKVNFLRQLVLDDTMIEEIPDSIRYLTKLTCLSLNHCTSLTKLPDSIGQLTSLVKMNLSGTRIGTLPDSVGRLCNLEVLNIDDSLITDLPGTIGALKKLKVINASECTCLNGEIPPDIGMLSLLRILRLDGTNINSLPGSISKLSHLQTLSLTGCEKLQSLPDLPSSLAYLYMTCEWMLSFPHLSNLINLKELSIVNCVKLKEISGGIGKLTKLEKLRVYGLEIITLPEETGALSRLKELFIIDCIELRYLPKLPSSLYDVRILDCRSFEKLPNLSNLNRLSGLYVGGCDELTEIQGLGDLVSLATLHIKCSKLTKIDGLEKLESLKHLEVSNCASLERLPDLSMLVELTEMRVSRCEKLAAISDLSDLKKLESLHLEGCKSLREIEGLDGLDDLQFLSMSGCTSIEALTDLSNLTKLDRLFLNYCQRLAAISDLSNLKKLRRLELKGCRSLRGIEGLDGLDGLQFLSMRGCTSIEVLSDLSNLKKLEYLNFWGCQSLRDIEGLEELESLKWLAISECRAIEKLPNLSKLKKLRWLSFIGCDKVTGIQGLEGPVPLEYYDFPEFRELENVPNLQGRQLCGSIQSRFGCSKFTNLGGRIYEVMPNYLYVSNCGSLERLPDLSMLMELTDMIVSRCEKLASISDLSSLKKLESLHLEGCHSLREIEGLDGLDSLRYLGIYSCTSVEALSDLSNLKKLKDLELNGCQRLREIEGLEELESLTSLDIFECRAIEKLPNLSKLQKLRRLSMSGCDKVTGIQGLEELKSLEYLNIGGCTALENVPDLPNVEITH